MKDFMQQGLSRNTLAFIALAFLLVACSGGGGDGNSSNSTTPATPTPTPSPIATALPLPGPFAVACSNISQDFSRVTVGSTAKSYWEGLPASNGAPQYISSLLADPANTLSVTVNAPIDSELYGSFAGKQTAFILLTCYPTTATNTRANYALPGLSTGITVPHMQTGSEAPLFAVADTKYPVILFSHGYSGSPISNEYLSIISTFASYGYVVIAPFHGDGRFSDLRVEDFGDAAIVLTHIGNLNGLQALRPLSMSAALDLMLAHPQWRDHLDATQIGGFGGSMGGETLMLMGGAALTTSFGQSSTRVTLDSRLKAAVGYVPYFGQPFLPAFGRDQRGIDGVTLPYMAIAGTADTTAPIIMTQQGLTRHTGIHELISLEGVKHGFDVPSTNDIFTWSLIFFNAEVRGQTTAREQLRTMTSVAGGGDDRVVIPYNGAVVR